MASERQILNFPGKARPYLMAHRGNKVACPENTLAAFQRALVDGADIIETDLRLTADDVFVCIHDDTVDRTTNGSGAVGDMTLAGIKELSAAYGRPEFVDERVPTLAELAAILPDDVALALELKTDRFLEPRVALTLAQELDQLGVRGRTVVLSFSFSRLQSVRAVAPGIPVGWITLRRLWPRHEPELLGPFWPFLLLNPAYVAWAHRSNQLVCPLDSAPNRRLWLYRWLGCDAILSDDPGATGQALGRKAARHSAPEGHRQ